MELNKVIGALCSTLLVFLGLGFFSELIFQPHHHDELAFALAVEESDDGGEKNEIDIGEVFAAADPAEGEKTFRKCQACHKLEDGANSTGPYLWGVVDRPIDTADGYDKYTGALLQMGEKWTPENLYHFLENPRKEAPGTAMSFAGLKKPQDRADLIAYLNEADGSPEPLPQPKAETAENDAAAGDEAADSDAAPAGDDAAKGDEAAKDDDAAKSDAAPADDKAAKDDAAAADDASADEKTPAKASEDGEGEDGQDEGGQSKDGASDD